MHVFFFQNTGHAMPKMIPSTAFSEFLAQTSEQAPQGGIPGMMIFGYLLLFAAMYFFMIAPQRRKQKEHERMVAALGTGDEVVTTGGIFGVITNVKQDRFVVRIADNTKIELGKGFVQTVVKKPDAGDRK
jgi:preprotein translocase subunit YajC